MQNKNVQQAVIAGLALGFFVFVACVLYVVKNKTTLMPSEKEATVTESENENKVTEIKESVDLSEWRQYGNKAYGYEIKYPTDLTLQIPTEEKFLSGPVLQKVDFRRDDNSFVALEVWPKDYDIYADDLEKNLPYKNLTINGQKAVRLDVDKTDGGIYSSETTIYGPKYTYQIIYNEINSKTLEPLYDQIISTFILNDEIDQNKMNYWELTSGNQIDTCSNPTFKGEATVHGWYSWDYVYVEKDWVLNISPDDAKKLPVKEILGDTQ
ncbi:MAG TPA: hypothetical protein VK255_01000, partial [Patescibacteria group bacterium]|nr:hypothetical protein [Patescibacteria group bacterium]